MKYKNIASTFPSYMTAQRDQNGLPSLEDAIAYINHIDFSLIHKKICSTDSLLCRTWSSIEAEIGIQYYKNFLFLNKKYIEKYPILPPMLEVDEIWHHHILDTRQYMKDCENIFGYYFHHYPYFGIRGNWDKDNLDTAFEVVQQLHQWEFGNRMVSIWGERRDL